MRKTSIFFLIISVILIISGFILKNKAIETAEAEKIDLFRQTLTDNGDFIETIEFSTLDTNKININLKDTDINISGSSTKSYVEILNFNVLEYATYSNNRTFNIEDDLISAVVGRAQGGNIKFDGIRDYVRFDKHNSKRIVNIYLSTDSSVKIFDINIKNGNINIDNTNLICDYNVVINEGNLKITNIPEISLIKAEIKKGNINLVNTFSANTDIKIENGNIDFSTPNNMIYDFSVESETGEIKYNEEIYKGTFILENEEINGNFKAHIGVGKVTIKTIAPTIQQPVENQNA